MLSFIWKGKVCNLAIPKIISPNFGDFLNKSSGINIIKFRKIHILKCFLRLPPAGLGKGMLDQLGNVSLGQPYSCNLQKLNIKYCNNKNKFSQGPLKYTSDLEGTLLRAQTNNASTKKLLILQKCWMLVKLPPICKKIENKRSCKVFFSRFRRNFLVVLFLLFFTCFMADLWLCWCQGLSAIKIYWTRSLS